MSSTVHVEGISKNTTEKEVRDFFSFCGKIQDISITQSGESQAAKVTFEKDSAAKTALLLDSTQLGDAQVHVTSEHSHESGASAAEAHESSKGNDSEIEQEEKPRTRIVAEYLAHGYRLGDHVIQRAISFDQANGISQRFSKALTDFDSKYNATEKTRSMDEKYGVSSTAAGAWSGFNSYFEQAINTQSGQKLRAFYDQGQKQVLDVHNEAMHLANLKKQHQGGAEGSTVGSTSVEGKTAEPFSAGTSEGATGGVSQSEKAGAEHASGPV